MTFLQNCEKWLFNGPYAICKLNGQKTKISTLRERRFWFIFCSFNYFPKFQDISETYISKDFRPFKGFEVNVWPDCCIWWKISFTLPCLLVIGYGDWDQSWREKWSLNYTPYSSSENAFTSLAYYSQCYAAQRSKRNNNNNAKRGGGHQRLILEEDISLQCYWQQNSLIQVNLGAYFSFNNFPVDIKGQIRSKLNKSWL